MSIASAGIVQLLLIKKAEYLFNDACMENIEYHSDRSLDKVQLTRLSSCRYIEECHNIIVLGATGSGKTYLSTALGMPASRNFYIVKYVRLPELLAELALSKGDGHTVRLLSNINTLSY